MRVETGRKLRVAPDGRVEIGSHKENGRRFRPVADSAAIEFEGAREFLLMFLAGISKIFRNVLRDGNRTKKQMEKTSTGEKRNIRRLRYCRWTSPGGFESLSVIFLSALEARSEFFPESSKPGERSPGELLIGVANGTLLSFSSFLERFL